jgi:hypothetical protein
LAAIFLLTTNFVDAKVIAATHEDAGFTKGRLIGRKLTGRWVVHLTKATTT